MKKQIDEQFMNGSKLKPGGSLMNSTDQKVSGRSSMRQGHNFANGTSRDNEGPKKMGNGESDVVSVVSAIRSPDRGERAVQQSANNRIPRFSSKDLQKVAPDLSHTPVSPMNNKIYSNIQNIGIKPQKENDAQQSYANISKIASSPIPRGNDDHSARSPFNTSAKLIMDGLSDYQFQSSAFKDGGIYTKNNEYKDGKVYNSNDPLNRNKGVPLFSNEVGHPTIPSLKLTPQSSYAPHPYFNEGTNAAKIQPMPIPKNQGVKYEGNGSSGPKEAVRERQNYNFNDDSEKEDSVHNKTPQTLRSSFDYIDVNMNDAMKVVGEATLTGRGQKFFKKTFKEDKWSGDESVFNRQIKMPNVNAERDDYEQEVGLHLVEEQEMVQTLATDAYQDPLQEYRELMPQAPFYKIVKKDRIKIIDDYTDRCPLLELRKSIMRARVYINRGAQMVMQHKIFENASITVICVNSLFLAMDDPLRDPALTPAYMTFADLVFQYLYTVEMFVKVVSLGFILNKGSYIRDPWNILDFTIVSSGYIGMILAGSGVNLQVLRSFRVIRPLRTISTIKGLRIIVSSLINAIPLLRDALLILMFFFLIFSIAGTQLFMGALKLQCYTEDTSTIWDMAGVDNCGGAMDCAPGYFCGKANFNPGDNAMNFDNVMFSMQQVFQAVTMNGYTATMINLEQSVGTWILIYYYPIIFIGTFFLLNLTLAVIKAKFSEEMENKREQAKPKKKKLDDAPLSSEDEDVKPLELQEKIEQIKISKQMSPRSKEIIINKIKIEHMLWKVDTIVDKKDVLLKVVEKPDEEDAIQSMRQRSMSKKEKLRADLVKSQNFNADKIRILQPPDKMVSFTTPKLSKKEKKVMSSSVKYSQVFYGNKNTVYQPSTNTKENLKDIFQEYNQKPSTSQAQFRPTSPIQEDEEEEQDVAGLMEGEDDKAFDVRRRDMRRRKNSRPGSGGKPSLAFSESKKAFSKTQTHGFAGVQSWLGNVFEVHKQKSPLDESSMTGELKKLIFAGNKTKTMKGNSKGFKANDKDHIERTEKINREVYERITNNFDVFEFLDERERSQRVGLGHELNEEENQMSEELEFEIDDYDLSAKFDTTGQRRNAKSLGREEALDLDDDEEEEIDEQNSDKFTGSMLQKKLLRGSTQATAAENSNKKSGEDLVPKYTSPFTVQKVNTPINSLRASQKIDSSTRIKRKQNQEEQVVKENGIMQIFNSCKKLKIKRNTRNFQEEYVMLKKRAKSIGANRAQKSRPVSRMQESFMSEFDFTKDQETKTVRAKSIEQRQRHLLSQTIKFNNRNNIMKKRRAQYFAPAIKTIGVEREEIQKENNKFVDIKRKMKIDKQLIDEKLVGRRFLFRNASTDAIIRTKERQQFEALMPLGPHGQVNKQVQEDFLSTKCKEDKLELDSQRSQFLNNDYERIVDNYIIKELQQQRIKEQEEVPDMDQILNEKELKIMVKMTNHQYTSINDIFNGDPRGGKYITDQERKIIDREQKKKEALKLKLPKRIHGRSMILGYQKKVFIREKLFHEELLRNEFDESDEDQDGMMTRIETEYNHTHKSHIFVTGTVSVVVNKPVIDNTILNQNYHSNIRATILQRENDLILQKLLQDQKEQEELDKGKHKKAKVFVTYDDQRYDNSSMQPPVVEGSMWKKIQNMNFSTNGSGFSGMKMKNSSSKFAVSLSTKLRGGSMAESVLSKSQTIQQAPKPELLSDKKVLRRLNDEVRQSKIFQAINIKKLPEKIVRRLYEDKSKKKKDPEPKAEEDSGEDESSGDDEKERKKYQLKVDYFLERPVDGEYHITCAKDAASIRHKDEIEWSGQDVMCRFDPYKTRIAVQSLDTIRVWQKGITGIINKRRVALKWFMRSPFMEHGMTCMVVGNTIVLAMDFYGASDALQLFNEMANKVFTFIFLIEMICKITAIGIAKYHADKMNYMDGSIVILSTIELIISSGGGAMSALRSVRIFRIFRVLRVARLLRGLKSMVQIINVLSRAMQSFIYMTMLLLLFIFIYSLIGMQVFGGNFRDPNVVGTNRYNFDSFNYAFVCSFVVLTCANWNSVLIYAYSSSVPAPIIAIYFVSLIFIGNWMLLNLLLSILLDSFAAQEEDDMMTDDKKTRIKENKLQDLRLKQGEDFIEGMEDLQKEGFVLKSDKKKKKKKKRSGKKNEKKPQPGAGMILDESQEVDLQELARRDEQLLAQRKQLFRGIDCEMSCYLMSKESWVRILCYKTLFHQKFETLIMVIICLSSFKLVFDTYTSKLSDTDMMIVVSDKLDYVFQALFTLEMTIKIIAFGFVMDDGGYLTDAWNKLDSFIVLTGMIDLTLSGVNIPFIKVLRLLRILRPLRFVSHSSSMKTMIEALLASMSSIMNVGVVILLIFLMFAILGVNLFAGKTQYCSENYYTASTPYLCYQAHGVWTFYDQNMDNVIRAMITLFIQANGEDWPDVMYQYTDITGIATGPIAKNSLINAYFFVFFVFLSQFFLMNLFVGVLFMNFEKAQRDEKDAMLLDGDEVRWVDMMKMICGEKPEIIKIPKNPVSRWCYEFTKDGSQFSNFIMACIILNIFSMAAIFDGMSANYQMILDDINYIFTGAFTLECILKLTATGGAYFNSGWNKFDFFVVSSSYLDIVMNTLSASSLKVIKVGPQIARIMRVLRVSRLFKLLNKYRGLQALMQTIAFSMPSVINAFALLLLVYFIFSVLGVFFFKDIDQGMILDPVYMNFHNFSQSFIMMFRMSTGEDWPPIMFDCMNTLSTCTPGSTCGSAYAPVFFITYVLLQIYIMINLFVLIILQQFDLYYLPNDNVLDRFKSDLANFKSVWRKYSNDFEGFKIRGTDIQKFFKELKGDLGMANERDPRDVERNLVIMNIQSDQDGSIYFNELLFKTMKRRYANGRTKKKMLFELELETLEKLEKIMNQQVVLSGIKERQKAGAVNPFLSMMYKNMSFNVWVDIYSLNLPKRQGHIALGLEREISDEDESEEEVVVEEEKSEYFYETEEDELIDEDDSAYQEYIESNEASKADPLEEEDEEETPNKSRIVESKQYDQLRQEDEILDQNGAAKKGVKK